MSRRYPLYLHRFFSAMKNTASFVKVTQPFFLAESPSHFVMSLTGGRTAPPRLRRCRSGLRRCDPQAATEIVDLFVERAKDTGARRWVIESRQVSTEPSRGSGEIGAKSQHVTFDSPQRGERGNAERDDEHRIDYLDCRRQEMVAFGDLGARGLVIYAALRPRIAQHSIGGEHLFAFHSDGREQPFKVPSRLIPVQWDAAPFGAESSRRLGDEERACMRRAVARSEHATSTAHPRTRVARIRGAHELLKREILRLDPAHTLSCTRFDSGRRSCHGA